MIFFHPLLRRIEFSDRELVSITSDDILRFLARLTNGTKQTTRHNCYSSLKAFFNYVRNTIDYEIQNPCYAPDLNMTKRYPKGIFCVAKCLKSLDILYL